MRTLFDPTSIQVDFKEGIDGKFFLSITGISSSSGMRTGFISRPLKISQLDRAMNLCQMAQNDKISLMEVLELLCIIVP